MERTPSLTVIDHADNAVRHEGFTPLEISAAEKMAGIEPYDISFPLGHALRYGADPSGVADSTAPLQRWINATWAMYNFTDGQGLWSGSGGCIPVLDLPPGKYRLTDTLYLPTGVTIRTRGYPSRTTNHTRLIMDSTGLTPGRTWTANTEIVPGGRGIPSSPNGRYYVTTGGGTTGSTEPVWPTTIGNTVGDGSITWLCAAVTTPGDNRNKPIFKFRRGTNPTGGGLANSACTTTIQGLEFWYVVYATDFSNPLSGAGLALGDYPLGGSLAFDVDTADFMVKDCVFQHSPASIWCKNINESPAMRGDGFTGNRGIGIFFEQCEFDAAGAHIWAQNCYFNMFFRNCLFYGVLSSYGGCTGKVVYNNCWFETNAYIEATGRYGGGANSFAQFAIKGCDVEAPSSTFFISLNSASVVDLSQNTFGNAATNGGIYVRDVPAGNISDNIFVNIGTGSSAGTGLDDFIAVIKAINCQRLKICNNGIVSNDAGTYNGFGILTASSGGTSQYNFVSGNTVTAPFTGATFNLQNRHINLASGDILGINYSTHVTDVGYLSRNLSAQVLTIQDGATEPAVISGAAIIYVDTADGDLKIKFADGTVKIIVVDT